MPFYSSITAAEADGLVHYWIMNEATGDQVADIIGGWTGKLYGRDTAPTESDIAASIVATPSGLGRDLGAKYSGDDMDIMPIRLTAPAPSLTPLPELTIRIRFLLTSELPTLWTPFGLGYNDGAYVNQYEGSTGFYWQVGTRDGDTGTNPFTVGEWHDLVVCASAGVSSGGSGIRIYLDGTEFVNSTSGSNIFDIYTKDGDAIDGWIGAFNLFTGGAIRDFYPADIIVQDFAIWNRALSASEVDSVNLAGQSEDLTPPPPTEVSFDATVPYSAQLNLFTPSAYGFHAVADFSAFFEVYQDWTKALNSLLLQETYQMVITGSQDGVEDLIVPISSWQATNQSDGRQAFLQAVIPAASDLIDAIAVRSGGELVIRKGFRLPSGESQFSEIIRSAFDSLRYDRSGGRFTVTVSGYRTNEGSASGQRALTGVRSLSVTDGLCRVRCDIDLFLRPGMTVTAADKTFTASYINYFVSSTDKFCEVSER